MSTKDISTSWVSAEFILIVELALGGFGNTDISGKCALDRFVKDCCGKTEVSKSWMCIILATRFIDSEPINDPFMSIV